MEPCMHVLTMSTYLRHLKSSALIEGSMAARYIMRMGTAPFRRIQMLPHGAGRLSKRNFGIADTLVRFCSCVVYIPHTSPHTPGQR